MNELEIMEEHLKKATNLESKKYTYQELINKINLRIFALKNQSFYCDSSYAAENEYLYNNGNKNNYVKSTSKLSKKNKIIVALIVCFFFPLLMLLLFGIMSLIAGNSISNEDINGIIFIVIAVLLHILIPISIIALIVFLVIKKRKKDAKRSFDINRVNHQQNLMQSQRAKQAAQHYIEQYLQALKLVNQYLSDVNNHLAKHYSQNILYPKYRNFAAVATMYEWLCSGVCVEIKGHGGLYDKYEDYVQRGIIITELKQANALLREGNRKLDTVISNQKILIEKVEENNNICENIYSSLTRIEYNEQAQAYYLKDMDKQLQNINQRQSWY